jgi:MFS family permease
VRWRLLQEEAYDFAPTDRAILPGSPAHPDHALWRQVVFFLISFLLCITSNLVNGLVQVNAPALMGALGVDSSEIVSLPTVYSMTFIGMNLLLVRFRQQFGLRAFTLLGVGGCCAVMALHLVVGGFTGAVMVHAAAGVAAAPLSALAVYYMMEAMPKRATVTGAVLALGFEQLSTPFARLISTHLVDYDQWRSLYLFEFGLTAICLGAVGLFRLPANQRVDHFRPLDIVTFLLMAPGLALVCAVLGLGAALWWPDRAWFGWALALAVVLIGLALKVESGREHPLLDLKWLTAPTLIRFAVVIVVTRIVLGEQTSATGFLGLMGVNNDELHAFAGVLLACTFAGAILAGLVFRPNRITELCALAIGLVAVAAFHDSHATNLVRAPQFFVSQGLIAFATALFMGPAVVFGIGRVIKAGGGPLASFLVLFTSTQNLGGLGGGALLQTFQILREKANSAEIASTVSAIDAATADRIAHGGLGALQAAATREANVLAYNNTFLLVAVLAAATTVYLAGALFMHWRGGPQNASPPPARA